ncbi:MAG: hypothetical protein RTV72_14415 [Candidatus Thorarchaeota archaeon]
MKKSSKLFIVSSIAFLVIFLTASSMVIAFPGETGECGPSCHSTLNITVTSNATGTVDAYQGEPFTLTIDASGYTEGDTEFYVAIEPSWANNNQFSFTTTSIQDNSGSDLNANLNEISISVAFTPLSIGTYTIRIWAGGNNDVAGSLDVTVSVTSNDTTPPVIDSPSDMIVSEGDSLADVTWNPTDANPDRYEVFDNEASWLSGSWDGSSILVPLDSLTLGLHNITLAVYDLADLMTSDQVDVTVVDDTLPVIDFVDDQIVSEGALVSLTWPVSDLHPSYYEVFQDEVSIDSGVWDGSDISTPLSSLTLGVYNFTLFVNDTSGNSAVSQVNVDIVDGTAPLVNSPDDIIYIQGQTGFTIVWTPSDAHPSSYEILENGSVYLQGDWNSTGESVSINVDGLTIGTHNFTFIASDIGNNIVVDEVLVEVISAVIPYLNSPDDLLISEGTEGTEIIWSPIDLNPASYEIYQDEFLIHSGLWNSTGEVMSVLLDGLTLGVYNFTIFVIDTDTNNATDTVWVTIFDGTRPLINSPDNITYNEGQTGFDISWTPSDLHPVSYVIYKDSIEIKSGLWNSSSEAITINLDSLGFGVYNFTVAVFDIGGNLVSDEVSVIILDATLPILDSPADFQYEQLTSGHGITWTPTDLNPASYSIYRNGVIVNSGGWNGSSVFIVVDWLIPGQYNYTLVVFDHGGNIASDTVIVTVTPTTTTSVTTTTTETSTTSTTTTTSETTQTGTTTGDSIFNDPVATPLILVVGTWVVIIVVVLLISEILIRKGKW